jgi:hypothetical protein
MNQEKRRFGSFYPAVFGRAVTTTFLPQGSSV